MIMILNAGIKGRIVAAAIFTLFFLSGYCEAEEQLMARVSVESKDVYVGEPFLMRVTVMGSTDAEKPDFSSLDGCEVEFAGGSNNSSHSVSIINGKVSRTVKKEYVFSYRLTPLRAGVLTIASVDVKVEGRVLRTNKVAVNVRNPEESEDFKLRIRLSREECYVGEPVLLDVTWYLGKDVNSFNFTAPLLDGEDFDVEVPDVDVTRDKQYFRVPIGKREFIAEKGRGTLEGRSYATLEFSVALIPRRPGVFTMPEFIVACETGGGLSTGDFFDNFFSRGFGRRERRRKYVVPSNTPTISVKELPLKGRPRDFAGHVGQYDISVSASPLEVNVGDPITLTVVLSGPDYLENVKLPPLESMNGFAGDFKIPEERASGSVEGDKKVFTQTIRAKREDIDRIPAVGFVSFDTRKGEYVEVSSQPIPLKVNPTRVVTAGDAEGIDSPSGRSALEQWKEGIAYNYEGEELLADSEYGFEAQLSRWWNVLFLVLAPVLFTVLLAGRAVINKRRSDPLSGKAKEARKVFLKRLKGMEKCVAGGDRAVYAELLEAFKEFLGSKLRRPGSALTAHDVRVLLAEEGVPEGIVESAKKIFEVCEAGTYAGSASGEMDEVEAVVEEVRRLAGELDGELR